MDEKIKAILNSKLSAEAKEKELDELKQDIKLAKDVLSGKFKYCPECDDFYLSKSYLKEQETKKVRVCVYSDPINSGGDDYADGYADISYSICPKGHKLEVDRKERLK